MMIIFFLIKCILTIYAIVSLEAGFFFLFFLNVKACFLGKIGRNIKLSSTELAQRMININLFRKGVLTFFLYPVMWFNPINYSYQGHSLPFSVKSSIIFWVECGVGIIWVGTGVRRDHSPINYI